MVIDWPLIKIKIKSHGCTVYPLERCDIGDPVGQGSAMNVYKGTCRNKNQVRNAAFKEHRYLVGNRQLVPKNVEKILNQYHREIKLMGKLRGHPNIIQIYGVTFKEKIPLLVVELADKTLDDYLRERLDINPMNWIDKTKLCLDVLSGVRGLCEADIIHGDLKGSNILVFINENGVPRAKISDFGFSSSMSSLQSHIGGTLRFLAPEKTLKHPELSRWQKKSEQDIYGLGMVTFQIATNGKTPYDDVEDVDAIYTAKDDPTFLLEELPLDTPEKYREIITITTQVEPEKRASLDTVEKLLKMILNDAKENLRYYGAEIIPFEDCTIGELRGHGQMLNVYEGTYKVNDQNNDCAFKMHRTWNHVQVKEKDEFIRNLCKEVDQMKKLQYHHNIVQILGVTFNDTMPILIVELTYSTLTEYLPGKKTEGQPVDWFQKTSLCLDVLWGVRELHKAGIIHGNLNGDSVMVSTETQTPKAKLSDFGSSSFIGLPEGTVKGTTKFSAPEQYPQHFAAFSQWRKKPKQDIYGLGMITFQVATDGLKTPYEDCGNDIHAVKANDSRSAALLAGLFTNTPDKYRKIIEGLTRFKPNERISLDTAEKEFRETLKELAGKDSITNIVTVTISDAVGDDVEEKDDPDEAAKEEWDTYKASYGGKPQEAVFTFAGGGDKNVLRLLLNEFKVDVNIKHKDKGWSLVHIAAKNGHTEVIKMLINEFSVDINSRDNFGRTAMHYAAKSGNVNLVEFLIKVPGVDVYALDNDRWTPLHYAARHRRIEVIKAFTNRVEVNINSEDIAGRTAIYLAASQGDVDMILELSVLKPDINIAKQDGWTPLHAASYYGKLEAVQLLLNLGAEINRYITSGDLKGCTPLDIAFKYHHDGVIKKLKAENAKRGKEIAREVAARELLETYTISKGIILEVYDPSTPNNRLDEALFWAAELGYSDVIRLLATAYKANIEAKDSAKDLTAIHFAAINGHTDTVRMLIKDFWMEVDAKNNKGTNAMHYAAKIGHINIIQMLIDEFKMGVHAKDNIGRTVIHYAAKNGRVEVIQFLAKETNADMKAMDNNRRGPLHYAAQYGRIDVIKALTNGIGVDVNSKDGSGQTAIYLAARQGDMEMILELVTLKADVNIAKWDGWMPIHTASHHGRVEAVQLLLELGAHKNKQVSGDLKGCTPLDIALKYGHADVTEILIAAGGKRGEEISELGIISEESKNGENTATEFLEAYTNSRGIILTKYDYNSKNDQLHEALFWAAESGYNDVIRKLAKSYRENVATQDSSKGLTAMHFAARNGRINTVRMLKNEYHMDVNVRSKKGANAMHYAAKYGHINTIKILVEEFGMSVKDKDNFGRTAIHYSAKNGRTNVIEYFITLSREVVNAKDSDGWTPLHFAARYGHIDVIKGLKGIPEVDWNNRDNTGRTAIYLAAREGSVEIIRDLAHLGAHVDTPRADGWTPLHVASFNGKLEAVRCLMELGADKNARVKSGDRIGYSPLDMAKVHKNTDLIRVIKNAGGRPGTPRWLLLFQP